MEEKQCFSKIQARQIRALLDEKCEAERSKQKVIRDKLRREYRFYITDFDTSYSGFTSAKFDQLIENGNICIC